MTKQTPHQIAKRYTQDIKEHLMVEGDLEMTNQKEDYIILTYDKRRQYFAIHLNGKCMKIAKRLETLIVYLYNTGTTDIKLIY